MVLVFKRKVKKHERRGIHKSEAMLLKVNTIENLLKNFYETHCPKSSDYANRRDMIHIFNLMAKEIYGEEKCPVVEEFGSFVMDMFSSDSDLDLSIRFGNGGAGLSRDAKIKTLRRFAKKFNALQRAGHVKNIQPVLTARVPIVKVTDCGTGIECDLSVENTDGVAKSLIISMITAIDERFQKLSVMLKAWAKAQGINSSKDGTLNSLSLISLAAFHLQRQKPPILPPFSSILKDGFDVPSVKGNIQRFLNLRRKNEESVAKLFTTLLIRLSSVRTLWTEGLCASIYEGSWIQKTFNDRNKNISVEDFTNRSQNVARAVGSKEFIKIYKCVDYSLDLIKSFTDGTIEGTNLECLLFGPDPSPEIKRVTNLDNFTVPKPSLVDPTRTKKARITGEWGEGAPSTSSEMKDHAIIQPGNNKAEINEQSHDLPRSEELGARCVQTRQPWKPWKRSKIKKEKLDERMHGSQNPARFVAPSISSGNRDHALIQSVNNVAERNDKSHGLPRSEELGARDVGIRQPHGRIDNQMERLDVRMYGSQNPFRFVAPSTSSGNRDRAIVQTGNYLVERNDQSYGLLRSEELGAKQPWGRIDNQMERVGESMYGSQHPSRFLQGSRECLNPSERTFVGELRGGMEPYGNHLSNLNPWAPSFTPHPFPPSFTPHPFPNQASMAYPRLGLGVSGVAPPQAPYSSELLNRTHIQSNVPNQMPRHTNPPNFW